MELKTGISLARMRIAAVIIILGITHLGYFIDSDIRDIWFTGNCLAFVILSYTNKPKIKLFNDITNGFFTGYFIDTLGLYFLDLEMNHTGELLAVAFPICGYLWRNYRSHTYKALAVSGVSLIIKYIAMAVVWLFDKLFS